MHYTHLSGPGGHIMIHGVHLKPVRDFTYSFEFEACFKGSYNVFIYHPDDYTMSQIASSLPKVSQRITLKLRNDDGSFPWMILFVFAAIAVQPYSVTNEQMPVSRI